MAYPERLLADGEDVVLDLHPHWSTLVGPLALVPVVVGLASYGLTAMPAGRWHSAGRDAVLVAAGVVLVLVCLRRWLSWETTRYVVTTRRVLVRAGLLRRRGRDLPLNRVSDVSFSQTLRERMLRAGTMVLESAGEHGRVVIGDVPRVESVQRTVYRLIEAAPSHRAYPG